MFFPLVDLFFRFDRLYDIWCIEGAITVAAQKERTRSIVVVECGCLYIKQALSSNRLKTIPLNIVCSGDSKAN
jgi:hypothetical protein